MSGVQSNAERQTTLRARHVFALHGRQERGDPLRRADHGSDRERARPLPRFVATGRAGTPIETRYDHAHRHQQRVIPAVTAHVYVDGS